MPRQKAALTMRDMTPPDRLLPGDARDSYAFVQLQIRMPAAMHKRLKVRAFKLGRPIASLAREFIRDGLKHKPGAAP